MMYSRIGIVCLLCSLWQGALWAQKDAIRLVNPSFEDFPRQSWSPRGWNDCGFLEESPPDVQPSDDRDNLFWGVNTPPYQGNTYLGMVVRDNDTWEAVSQPLSKPLETGTCYKFSIMLCHSDTYLSQSRIKKDKEANYTTPAVLRVWGGSGSCSKRELLAESIPISNTTWKEYTFKLSPKQRHTSLVLEAFYKVPTLIPYNGNLLVDYASDLVPMSCNERVAAVSTPPPSKKADDKKTKPTPAKTPPAKANPTPAKPPIARAQEIPPPPVKPTPPKEEKPKEELSQIVTTQLKVGQVIRVDKLYFQADTSAIEPASEPALTDIYTFLSNNPSVVVEVGGHTNSLPDHSYCDKLSTARAKAVAEYLIGKGIPSTRVKYKGYGKRQPIASDKSLDGRQKNQRVEIKILSVDG